MRIVGLIVAIVGLIWAAGGQNLKLLIDPASIILVVGVSLGLLWFSGARLATMFKAVFSKAATVEELRAGAKAWKLAGVYFLASGAIGTILGLIVMLNRMDDPAQIGPGMAIAIITNLYGAFLAFAICLPLQSLLEDRIKQQTAQS